MGIGGCTVRMLFCFFGGCASSADCGEVTVPAQRSCLGPKIGVWRDTFVGRVLLYCGWGPLPAAFACSFASESTDASVCKCLLTVARKRRGGFISTLGL